MTRYRIDWDALNALPPDQRMAALAAINTSIRTVTGAERARMVHRAVAEYGTQKDAAAALGISPGRTNQIIKENPMSDVTVTLSYVGPAELYRRYQDEHAPQPCYVEVDLKNQWVGASYNAEVGNAIPMDAYHGFERRYPIPALTSTAANELLEKVKPLAERMCSDWEEEWNGDNMKARLGDDAAAAEEEIQALCEEAMREGEQITVWDVDGATTGTEAADYRITAETTDERLEEIEEEIRQSMKEPVEESEEDTSEVVLDGIAEYLRDLRDNADAE